MKKTVALCTLLLCFYFSSFAIEIDSLTYGKFGKILIYHTDKTPTSVALFVSGDGGWKSGVINMAKFIALQGALVLGIDAKHYNKSLSKLLSDCYYPAADFEELSFMIQKKYKFQKYIKPVLIGYSYGAVLIYGILVQAPTNTFKGAIALGFCPDIELKKPLCKGNGLTQHVLKKGVSFYLERSDNLTAPFIALNGVRDQTCPINATASFMKGLKNTDLVILNKVGHGFSIADNWLPQFNQAYRKILNTPSSTAQQHEDSFSGIKDKTVPYKDELPLIIIPSLKKNNLPFIFMISGDGGWTNFDQSVSESLAAKGFSVLGLDAQKYFWNKKTPEIATKDIEKAIVYYRSHFEKDKFIFAGYSFGASILPFIASRLTFELKPSVAGIFALSPAEFADFEIHVTDMLNLGKNEGEYNVLAEFKKIKSIEPVCYFGKSEDPQIRGKFSKEGLKVLTLPGNHHFDNDFNRIAEAVIESVTK